MNFPKLFCNIGVVNILLTSLGYAQLLLLYHLFLIRALTKAGMILKQSLCMLLSDQKILTPRSNKQML